MSLASLPSAGHGHPRPRLGALANAADRLVDVLLVPVVIVLRRAGVHALGLNVLVEATPVAARPAAAVQRTGGALAVPRPNVAVRRPTRGLVNAHEGVATDEQP